MKYVERFCKPNSIDQNPSNIFCTVTVAPRPALAENLLRTGFQSERMVMWTLRE
jgi:hypothetical protein